MKLIIKAGRLWRTYYKVDSLYLGVTQVTSGPTIEGRQRSILLRLGLKWALGWGRLEGTSMRFLDIGPLTVELMGWADVYTLKGTTSETGHSTVTFNECDALNRT